MNKFIMQTLLKIIDGGLDGMYEFCFEITHYLNHTSSTTFVGHWVKIKNQDDAQTVLSMIMEWGDLKNFRLEDENGFLRVFNQDMLKNCLLSVRMREVQD